MRMLTIVPDTDFHFENDYPIIKYNNKIYKLRIYANDNNCVVSEYGKRARTTIPYKNTEFICWEKEKNGYEEYFV